MLITNDFVMLNFPKTGSSFVRDAIKSIYKKRYTNASLKHKLVAKCGLSDHLMIKELLLPNIKITGVKRAADQHGCYTQIPRRFRQRQIVSVVRNPYTRFLSEYEYRWWALHPPVSQDILMKYLPHFPALSLDDFVLLKELTVRYSRLNNKKTDVSIGNQTVQFIQMFFKNPAGVLNRLSDDYLNSDEIFRDIADIHFLRQENLNEELTSFLSQYDYSSEEIEYVKRKEPCNVTKKRSPDRKELWTEMAIEYIQKKERMIFRLLEKYGIDYDV